MAFYVNLLPKKRGLKVGDWVEIMNISDYQLNDIQRNQYPKKGPHHFIGQKYQIQQVYGDDQCLFNGWTCWFMKDQVRRV